MKHNSQNKYLNLNIMKKKVTFKKLNCDKQLYISLFFIAISLFLSPNLSAVTTKTVGATGADYTTISAALADYGTTDADGYVIVLNSDYAVETTLALSTVATSGKPITIRPAASLTLTSVAWTISGSYITVDGQVGGTGGVQALSIVNTSTTGVPLTISGSNNTIKYVSLQGSNTSNASGVVVVSGGSSNTIDNCEITSYNNAGTWSYSANSVYCAVAGANTLSNCKIHDIFSAGGDFYGVCLITAASGWTITGNSFYNTVSTGASTSTDLWAYTIYIKSGSGYTISNNYFGGRSSQCGGTDTADKMLIGNTSATKSFDFRHIYFECTGTTKNTINGNTFKNINFVTQLSTGPYWGAIYVINKTSGASFDIKNNIIGSTNTNANINVYWYGSASVGTQSVYGIYIQDNSSSGPSNVDITGNTIGGISVTANPAVTGGAMGFGGIIANAYGTINISSNNIGSSTVYNSIQNDFVGTTVRTGGSTSIIGASNGSSVTIQNNNIYNITAVSADYASFSGITATGLGGNIISGNTLRNLKFRGDNKYIYTINACIFMNAITAKSVNSVYNNSVYNVCNRDKDANIAGIEIYNGGSTGTGGAKVYNNTIYNLQPYTAFSGTYSTSGISVLGYNANANRNSDIYNNMIRLGTDTLGNALTGSYQIYGISELNRNNVTYNNIYNNTVYIMGTGAAGYNTAAFYGGVAPNAAREIKNNIFVNNRAAGSTDKHYAIYLSSTSNTTIDYNDYVSASNYIGYLSADKTTLSAWKTATSQDAHSINTAPAFAGATASTPDLHLTGASGNDALIAGVSIATVTTDIDGNTRNTPPTIGADEIISSNALSSLLANITAATASYNAAVEGSSPGQYVTGSKATFLSVINAAQAVYDNSGSTQQQVVDANSTLVTAMATFEAGKEGTQGNLDALATTITSATNYYNASVEGSSVGQYSASSRSAISAAIATAQGVHDAQNSNDTQLTSANTTLQSAITTFRTSIVTDSHYLADGYYYIYVSNAGIDYYLSDISPYTMPAVNTTYTMKYQLKNSGTNLKYQEFKLTWDAAKSRYKMEGKFRLDNPSVYKNSTTSVAQAYVNEGGNFGGNAYLNDWNTMKITFDGTSYAIQKGESAGTDYWKPSAYAVDATTTMNPSASTLLVDNMIYKIVSATRTVTENNNLNTSVSDASTTVSTVTTGDATGEYTSSNVNTMNAAITAATTVYNNATATSSEIAAASAALATAKSTFLASINQTFSGTGNWSEAAKWSAGFAPSTTANVFVGNGADLTIDANCTVANVVVNSTSKLTLSSAKTLNATNITINSDASGTGTFVDNGSATITTATVNQYLASARNWYLSAPVSGATVPVGATYFGYAEPGDNSDLSVSGATAYWKPYVAGTSLAVGKGYIAQPGSSTTLSFSGTLNTGDVTVNLTRTAGKSKEGFNLVANPYPSYLSLKSLAAGDSANLETTYWIRSKTADGSSYVFDTYNFKGNQSLNSGSGKALTGVIAPMQAFWVRVRQGHTSGNIVFHNSFRSHIDDANNLFRVKAVSNQMVMRLQVSNGLHADETLIYSDINASNGYDDYDSQKMLNNTPAIPDLYTLVGNEQLAINGLNILENVEIPLGFSTLTAGSFNIKVSEMTNIPEDVQLVLKDYLDINNPITTNLSDSSVYTFTSEIINTNKRFTVVLKTKDVSTFNKYLNEELWTTYVNNNGQIVVSTSTPNSIISIYNCNGKRIDTNTLEATTQVMAFNLEPGLYLVKIKNDRFNDVRKLIVP